MKSDAQVSHLDLSELVAIAGRADRVHQHLATCELCQEIVSLIAGVREEAIPGEESASPHHRCIKEPEITKLFDENAETGPALELLRHAAGCDPCGRKLRELAFVFSADDEGSVGEIVSQLESSTPEWQKATVERLADPRPTTRRPWMLDRRVWAIAAAAVIIVAVGLNWNRWQRYALEQNLAQAYTDSRPFDFRLPDKGHSNVAVHMGATSLTPSLKKANAAIVDLPDDDPQKKLFQGRADLLGNDLDAAINELRSLDLPNEESSLDLAVALAVRAQTGQRPEDWGESLEYISRYLVAHPASKQGLYNKALLLEKMQHVEDAISAWDRYLEVDPTGPWADEARQRRDELSKKKTAWQLRRDSQESESAQQTSDPGSYLGRTKLIKFHDQPHDAQMAVGELLFQQHHDAFLRDVFSRSTPAGEAAFEHLKLGFAAVDQENYTSAVEQYRQAALGFAADGNLAGKYRAALEETYALQRAIQPEDCAQRAKQLHEQLALKQSYPWMQIQAEIQIASCEDLGGNTADALPILQQAQELAKSTGYREAELRASGIYADSLTRLGDRAVAWGQGLRDMETYWNYSTDPTRVYQILINQVRASERMGWVHAQTFLQSAACREIGRNPKFRLFELSCRIELAGAARRIQDDRLAAAQLTAAQKIADTIQGVNDRNSPAQAALIRYSSALVEANELRPAADRLDQLASAQNSDAFVTKLLYFTTLGRLRLANGKTAEAEDALNQAKELTLHHLSKLAKEADQAETADTATLYRLSIEAHLPADGKSNLRPEDLEAWEDFRARVRTPSRPPEPISKLAPQLKEEAVLILVRLRTGIAAWTVDSGGVSSRWTPLDMDELDKSVRRMTELCSNPSSRPAEIQLEGRKLYDWLIGPVAERLEGTNLIAIEPDESLSSVPFRALVTGSGDYWGRQAAIEQIDSVSDYLNRRSNPQPQPGGRTLLVSSPAVKGNLARLYPSLDSFGEPVSTADGRTIQRLPAQQATLSNIAKNSRTAEVFHFFGHATSTAQSSALLVAADNGDAEFLLNANRLRDEDWSKTRLVILSACSTALGETFGPANRDGLVRGFLSAGAARVIASQWDVDASATAQLFRKFYDQLAKSGDTARALQTAQTGIAQDGAHAHPYYWAAFNLFGTR